MQLLSARNLNLAWPLSRPYFALYCFAVLAMAGPFVLKKSSEWDWCYLPTATHLLAGEDIYAQAHGYVYPPLMSLFAVPLRALPGVAQKVLLFAVNAAALWIALRNAWRIAGGPDLDREAAPRAEHLASALGLVIGMIYFLNSLMHHQTDILLAALVLSGVEAMRSGRWLKAAALTGIAAAMKCTPLLFLGYFLWRGRFLAAAWLIAVAFGMSLLPDLIHSPPGGGTWLSIWFRTFLAPMASAEHRPGIWASDIIFNQSLVGAVNRWSLTTWSMDGGFRTMLITPLLSAAQMKVVNLMLMAVVGIVSLIALWKNRQSPDRVAWDASLVLCGMLLFSPMSSPAHFGLLVLPAFLLARNGLVHRSRFSFACVLIMTVLALASNKDLLGAKYYSLGLWHGSVMLAAVTALVGTWQSMLTTRRRLC